MLTRWISAGIGIPLFIGICIWGSTPFAVGVVALALLGLVEMLKAYSSETVQPSPLLAAAGLLGPAWALRLFRPEYHAAGAAVLGFGLAAVVWEVLRAARTGEMHAARNTAYGLLCGLYIALFGGMVLLRSWPGNVRQGPYHGLPLGLALVTLGACSVWATDSAALFAGRFAGKRKLAPRLSPGKTVEGAIGGLMGGLAIGGLFGYWLLREPGFGLVVGAIAGIFGQIGDLFESALKREAGLKDFGGIMPGHGGVLDRFDSLLVVAPLVWVAALLWGLSG